MKNKNKPEYFFNRELSWIEFNKRVLEEAENPNTPLLERVKFLSIFCSNLDEFFMIRVSGLKRQVESDVNEVSSDGLTAQEQRDKIYNKLCSLIKEQYGLFNKDIVPALEENGIRFLKYEKLSDKDMQKADKYFDDVLFPILTPIAIDNVHPFPNLVNRTIALAAILDDPDTEEIEQKISVIPVPINIPRYHTLKNGKENEFILLEDIIKANVIKLFPGMKSLGCFAFRITRNADIELEEEEASDLLTLIEEEVKKRRLGIIVRLEVEKNIPDFLLDFLKRDLNLEKNEVYKINGPLNHGDLMNLYKIDRRDLKYEGFTPRISSYLYDEDDFFRTIKSQDVFLHHPFYSFSSVSEFIAQAADDPVVFAIKLILYRTSGDSPIIKSLITAAENGKQVMAVVELKARFDEENNIIWARALENAGVSVVYGISGLKTHGKMALVARYEGDSMKRYLHLGTGNYNPTTAKLYTDFGLFTSNEEYCEDASNLFNYLTGFSKHRDYKKLIVAPFGIRKSLMKMIDDEIKSHQKNGNGRIIAKTNSLVDEEIIVKLYQASSAGVKIDLLVRGICTLKPGVKNLSENINVYSIVGRFLEHSRAYYFHNNGDAKLYSGSADLMTRNFDRRVEILFPIEDKNVKEEIVEILNLYLKDYSKTRVLNKEGEYYPKSSLFENMKVFSEKGDKGDLIQDIQEYFVAKVKKKSQFDIKKKRKKKLKQNKFRRAN